MIKIKILSMGNYNLAHGESYYYRYEFEKKQQFIPAFRKFLAGLNITGLDVDIFGRPSDEHNDPIFSKNVRIHELDEQDFAFDNKEFHVNLIFRKNKILVLISSKTDQIKRIAKDLSKFCDWKKYEYYMDKDEIAKLKK